MDQIINQPWRPRLAVAARFLGFLMLGAALLLTILAVGGEKQVVRLLEQVDALGVWGPLAFGLVFIVLTMLLLPATPVVLASGAVFGVVPGVLLISAASTVSAALSFLISRVLAHALVAGRIRRYPKIDAVYRALGEDEGWKLVAAVRLSHALPYGVQNLLFGASPVRFGPFLAATWIAMLPGTLLYVYLGFLGARGLEEGAGAQAPGSPADWAVRLGALAAAAGAVFYAVRLGRRLVRDKAHVDLGDYPLSPRRLD